MMRGRKILKCVLDLLWARSELDVSLFSHLILLPLCGERPRYFCFVSEKNGVILEYITLG